MVLTIFYVMRINFCKKIIDRVKEKNYIKGSLTSKNEGLQES